MSNALERMAKNTAARPKKGHAQKSVAHTLLGGSSGVPPTGSGTSSSGPGSPADVSRIKRQRGPEIVDLEKTKGKEKFPLPPIFNNKDFFDDHPLYVHRAESLALGKMDLEARKAQMAKDVAAMIRVMSIATLYTGEETPEALS